MIHIPYGTTYLSYSGRPDAVLTSRIDDLCSERSGAELVKEAMENPIASPRLSELARGKKTATVIISDHTRPVPSRDILPSMLRELREGNPAIDITLLVATGCHRETTEAELRNKLGEEICERIHVHNAFRPEDNVTLGVLPSGAPLVLDRLAVETDLLVAEGFIEPHFFAGYSGGRKSVLPGVCDKVTVLGNHCGAFIADPHARTGILEGNPIHRDMVAAAKMAKLAYIVNVVIDEKKQTVAAFAGDFEKAHLAGTDFLRQYCEVEAVGGDIVISSNGGAPLDQNLYQCVKGLTAAEATANEGAVLIMCAEAADGIGGDGFYRSLRDCTTAEEFFYQCANVPQSETIPDQWQSQIMARILMKHEVLFVTRPALRQAVEDMKMTYCATLDEALTLARARKGEQAKVTVIPNGISVMVKGKV